MVLVDKVDPREPMRETCPVCGGFRDFTVRTQARICRSEPECMAALLAEVQGRKLKDV